MPMRTARRDSTTRRHRSRPGRLIALVHREGDATVFRVARQLASPNTWRTHWSLGHKQMKDWASAFEGALAVHPGGTASGAVKVRMRVTVTRQVPKARNFIRDGDDLRYTTKPLNDALKNVGLIYDDSEQWLEQGAPTQEISPDGYFWTIVRVEPAPQPGATV